LAIDLLLIDTVSNANSACSEISFTCGGVFIFYHIKTWGFPQSHPAGVTRFVER